MDWLTRRARRKPANNCVGAPPTSSKNTQQKSATFETSVPKKDVDKKCEKAHGQQRSTLFNCHGQSRDSANRCSSSPTSVSSVCTSLNNRSSYKHLVNLPPCVDRREWIADNALAFFHHVDVVYGLLSEYCTNDVCNIMCGIRNSSVFWIDDKGKKFKYSAPQYVDCVMSCVEKIVHSEECMPTKYGSDFSPTFDCQMKKMFRYIFNVLAHVYAHHISDLSHLNVDVQCLTLYRHFYEFSLFHELLESKDLQLLSEAVEEWIALNHLRKASRRQMQHSNSPKERDICSTTMVDKQNSGILNKMFDAD